MQLKSRVRERHHLAPNQARQRADQIDRRRILLVRHGAAADLPWPRSFAHFVYFAALQVIDFVSDPAQRQGGLDQQPGGLQHPVPCTVPTGQWRAEPEPGQRAPLDLETLRTKRRHGPHRARQIADQHPFTRLIKTCQVPVNFIDPDRDFVAKRGRQCLLTMGAGNHRRVLVAQGQREQLLADRMQATQGPTPGLLDLQNQPGIEDVLSGHAVMHVLTPPA
ncbi:hypothetical protein D3C79_546700 [compost metagenome]